MSGKISVAMATYNGEKFIKEQLDSILKQTIPFDELIIRDDCSTDNTWKLLLEYASKDTRIKLTKNQHNIGLVKNFELAIRDCSGDYIALSDQDDVWLNNHLAILISNIGNKAICLADAEIIDENGIRSSKTLSYCESRDYTPENDTQKAYTTFFYRGWFQGASMLLRKSFVEEALPIPDINIYHDFWFGCLACFIGGINYTPEIITLYRRHSKAVTGKKIRQSKIRTLISHVVYNKALKHRPILISELKKRIGDKATFEHKKFFEIADLYFKRRKTVLGRLRNLFFEIKHFNIVYSRNTK